jgi:hypothetical protein
LLVAATSSASAQNLLVNPSFEFPSFAGWTSFNNVFPTSDEARTGVSGGLILGPFFNLPNASGIFQDVPAAPGDIFQGSIYLLHDSTRLNGQGRPDIILGNGNVVDLAIEWRGAGNSNLGQAAVSRIADGQDPGLILDQFYQGSVATPPAPAGTTAARLVLLFIQPPTFDGGLVFFDDASMTLIPEPASASLLGLAAAVCLGVRRRVG